MLGHVVPCKVDAYVTCRATSGAHKNVEVAVEEMSRRARMRRSNVAGCKATRRHELGNANPSQPDFQRTEIGFRSESGCEWIASSTSMEAQSTTTIVIVLLKAKCLMVD